MTTPTTSKSLLIPDDDGGNLCEFHKRDLLHRHPDTQGWANGLISSSIEGRLDGDFDEFFGVCHDYFAHCGECLGWVLLELARLAAKHNVMIPAVKPIMTSGWNDENEQTVQGLLAYEIGPVIDRLDQKAAEKQAQRTAPAAGGAPPVPPQCVVHLQ
jgi:hypothetical protein